MRNWEAKLDALIVKAENEITASTRMPAHSKEACAAIDRARTYASLATSVATALISRKGSRI